MAEPVGRTPLGELIATRKGNRPADHAGITLGEHPIAHLFVLRGDEEVAAAAARCIGLAGAPAPLRLAASATGSIARPGPDEYLLRLEADAGARIDDIRGAIAGRHAALVDVSDNYAAIDLAGAAARDVLAAACPLDLDESAVPPGFFSRTIFGKAELLLACEGRDRFRLMTQRSFAPYLWLLLEEASREFGFAIAS